MHAASPEASRGYTRVPGAARFSLNFIPASRRLMLEWTSHSDFLFTVVYPTMPCPRAGLDCGDVGCTRCRHYGDMMGLSVRATSVWR